MTCDNCNLKSSKLDITVCFKLFKPIKQGEFTPPKFNIAPEKQWLEDYFPFGKSYFQGLC